MSRNLLAELVLPVDEQPEVRARRPVDQKHIVPSDAVLAQIYTDVADEYRSAALTAVPGRGPRLADVAIAYEQAAAFRKGLGGQVGTNPPPAPPTPSGETIFDDFDRADV